MYPSLKSLIRKKIRNRIAFCILFLFVIVGIVVTNFYSDMVKQLQNSINVECGGLEDFIISQVLVPNNEAIDFQLKKTNNTQLFSIVWIKQNDKKYNDKKLMWHWNLSWTYYYNLKSFDNNSFGYFIVNGSLFKDKLLIVRTVLYTALLILFILGMMLFLLPLSNSIPKTLVITPINAILELLNSPIGHENDYLNKLELKSSVTIEIEEIRSKINQLILDSELRAKAVTQELIAVQVVHDICSPLSSIEVAVSNLKEVVGVLPVDLELLNMSIRDIKNITNGLLSHYRESPNVSNTLNARIKDDGNKPRYIRLIPLLESLISQKKLERFEFANDIIFINETLASFSWVYIAPTIIKRMLSNLLNNAIESISKKSEIAKIKVVFAILNNKFNLIIEDNGCGIPMDKINHVLGGNSLKHTGRGFGLFSAKEYFESIGGDFDLKSTLNIGTTITLALPILQTPIWYHSEILCIKRDTTLIVLDDDIVTHVYWQNRFLHHSIDMKFFKVFADMMEWSHLKKLNSLMLFMHCDSLDDSQNWLNTINQFSNEIEIYLIIPDVEIYEWQNLATTFNIKLIAKSTLDSLQFTVSV